MSHHQLCRYLEIFFLPGSCAQATGVQWVDSLDDSGLESFHPGSPEEMYDPPSNSWVRNRNYHPLKEVSFTG